ncbi:hypothetical protein Tco_0281175 [Tanacetum coccineum]
MAESDAHCLIVWHFSPEMNIDPGILVGHPHSDCGCSQRRFKLSPPPHSDEANIHPDGVTCEICRRHIGVIKVVTKLKLVFLPSFLLQIEPKSRVFLPSAFQVPKTLKEATECNKRTYLHDFNG